MIRKVCSLFLVSFFIDATFILASELSKFAAPADMILAQMSQYTNSEEALRLMFEKDDASIVCHGSLSRSTPAEESYCLHSSRCLCKGSGVVTPQILIYQQILEDPRVLIDPEDLEEYDILGDVLLNEDSQPLEPLYDLNRVRSLHHDLQESFIKVYKKEIDHVKGEIKRAFDRDKALAEANTFEPGSAVVKQICCGQQVHRCCGRQFIKNKGICPCCRKTLTLKRWKESSYVPNHLRHEFCAGCGLELASKHKLGKEEPDPDFVKRKNDNNTQVLKPKRVKFIDINGKK